MAPGLNRWRRLRLEIRAQRFCEKGLGLFRNQEIVPAARTINSPNRVETLNPPPNQPLWLCRRTPSRRRRQPPPTAGRHCPLPLSATSSGGEEPSIFPQALRVGRLLDAGDRAASSSPSGTAPPPTPRTLLRLEKATAVARHGRGPVALSGEIHRDLGLF
jgi:hypothetical protein